MLAGEGDSYHPRYNNEKQSCMSCHVAYFRNSCEIREIRIFLGPKIGPQNLLNAVQNEIPIFPEKCRCIGPPFFPDFLKKSIQKIWPKFEKFRKFSNCSFCAVLRRRA